VNYYLENRVLTTKITPLDEKKVKTNNKKRFNSHFKLHLTRYLLSNPDAKYI
jgi:hypothetical protein